MGKQEELFDIGQLHAFYAKAKKYLSSLFSRQDHNSTNLKHASWILMVFLLLIIISSATYFRLGSYNLDVTQGWAEGTVNNFYVQNLALQIQDQYPTLPQNAIQQRAQEQYQQLLNDPAQAQKIQSEISAASASFKAQLQDEEGHSYLIGIDPYYFFRLTKNYINNGYTGEYVDENGTSYSQFQMAPTRTYPPLELHVWVQATIFKILRPLLGLDIKDLPLTVFFTPIIFMSLAGIVAFFVGKFLAGNLAGFISGMIVAVHPAILSRTIGGFSDTDPYNILFPLLVVLFILLALRSRNIVVSLIHVLLAIIALRLFAWAWVGYMFVVYIVGGALVGHLVVMVLYERFILQKKSVKQLYESTKIPALVTLSFGLCAIVVVSITNGMSYLYNAVVGTITQVVTIKDASINLLWPNVYTTVAELNPASWNDVVYALGGKLLLFTSLLGIVLFTMYDINKARKEKSIPRVYVLFICILWFGGMTYASFKGIRFTMLLVPIFGIGLGLFASTITNYIVDLATRSKELNPKVMRAIASIAFAFMLFVPVYAISSTESVSIIKRAGQINDGSVPSFDDAWYNTHNNIKLNSTETAIISSWWDFGHEFIAFSERGATADGGSQNTPQAHWLGRLLVEKNETKTVAILRMLDCDANGAFEKLYPLKNNDFLDTMDVLEQLLGVDTEEATRILAAQGFSDEDIANILQSTHCTPPQAFVITSEDMVAKAGVWAHFGTWNFSRAYEFKVAQELEPTAAQADLVSRFNLTETQARLLFAKLRAMSQEEANTYIAGFPQYMMTQSVPCEVSNTTVLCRMGMVIAQNSAEQYVLEAIAITRNNATMQVGAYRSGQKVSVAYDTPMNLVRLSDTGVSVQNFPGGQTLDIVYDEMSNTVVLATPELSQSTFTKLFYFDGSSMQYLNKFYDTTTLFGARVITYTVDWDAYLARYG